MSELRMRVVRNAIKSLERDGFSDLIIESSIEYLEKVSEKWLHKILTEQER